MKIRPEMLNVKTDVTKLMVAFRTFTKAPKIVFAKVAYFSKIRYHTSTEPHNTSLRVSAMLLVTVEN
jgi:hypothetical protein